MYFYFSSEIPMALKLSGAFFGVINDGVKGIDIDINSPVLVECYYLNNGGQITFLLDNSLSFDIKNTIVTDLNGGYLIKFLDEYNINDFSVNIQKKEPEYVATLFYDKGLKFSIETSYDFYIEEIKFKNNEHKIEKAYINDSLYLFLILKAEKTLINVYHLKDKTEKIISTLVDNYTLSKTLITEEEILDISKHKITTTYSFNQNIIDKEIKISKGKNLSLERLNEKIIPYVFLENFLYDDDITELVSDNILNNKEKLKEFLGNYIGVFPPPVFRDINEVGLIYKKDEKNFYVNYYTFELENKKISNVKKSE